MALELVATTLVEQFASEDAIQKLKGTDSKFDLSHAISAFIAEGIEKLPTSDSKTEAQSRIGLLAIESMLEATKDARLSMEQLSKLPRETAFLCQQFLTNHQQMSTLLKTISELLSSKDRSWVTPSLVHDNWRAIVRFSKSARTLRTALIAYGAASPTEASTLLQRQVEEVHRGFLSHLVDKPKLQAALESAKTFLNDKSAT